MGDSFPWKDQGWIRMFLSGHHLIRRSRNARDSRSFPALAAGYSASNAIAIGRVAVASLQVSRVPARIKGQSTTEMQHPPRPLTTPKIFTVPIQRPLRSSPMSMAELGSVPIRQDGHSSCVRYENTELVCSVVDGWALTQSKFEEAKDYVLGIAPDFTPIYRKSQALKDIFTANPINSVFPSSEKSMLDTTELCALLPDRQAAQRLLQSYLETFEQLFSNVGARCQYAC